MAIPSVHRQQQHNDTVNDGGVSGSDDTKDNPNNNLNNTTRNLNNVELMKVTLIGVAKASSDLGEQDQAAMEV